MGIRNNQDELEALRKRKQEIERKQNRNPLIYSEDRSKIEVIQRIIQDLSTVVDDLGKYEEKSGMKHYTLGINNIDENCCESCKELKIMKRKMDFSIPKVTIIYIVASSIALTFFIFNLYLNAVHHLVLINPYYSICFSIGSLGLLITAIESISDWKEYLKNGAKKR